MPVSIILRTDDSYHAETQSWKTPRSPWNVPMHEFAVLPPPPALLICVLQPPSALVRRQRGCPALAVGLRQLEKAFDVWGTICDGGDLNDNVFLVVTSATWPQQQGHCHLRCTSTPWECERGL